MVKDLQSAAHKEIGDIVDGYLLVLKLTDVLHVFQFVEVNSLAEVERQGRYGHPSSTTGILDTVPENSN